MTPGEALLDELSVKRPIPDAAGVTLPVERRLEAPDVRDSTMVPSAEAWRRSKMALLKRGRLAFQVGLGDVEPEVAALDARLVLLDARRCDLALEGGVPDRWTESRKAGASDLALRLWIIGNTARLAADDLAIGPALRCVYLQAINDLGRASAVPLRERVLADILALDGTRLPSHYGSESSWMRVG